MDWHTENGGTEGSRMRRQITVSLSTSPSSYLDRKNANSPVDQSASLLGLGKTPSLQHDILHWGPPDQAVLACDKLLPP